MPIIDAFVKQWQSWTALSLTRVDWRMNPSRHCPPIAKPSADWISVQDHNQAKSLGSCSWQPFLQTLATYLSRIGYYCTEGSILHLQNVWGACERPLAEWRIDPKSRCLGHSMRTL